LIDGHECRISCLAFAPDGKTLASGGLHEPVIRLWDPATGKQRKVRGGPEGWVRCLTLTPDGSCLVTGSDDNTLRLWDPATGKGLQKWVGASNCVTSLACAPDGQSLAVGSYPATIQLLHLKTKSEHTITLGKKHGWVVALAFSPSGKLLASADSEGN